MRSNRLTNSLSSMSEGGCATTRVCSSADSVASRLSLENDLPFARAPAEEEEACFEALLCRCFFPGGRSSESTSIASSYRERDFDFEDEISSEGSLPFPPLVVAWFLGFGRCSGCCSQKSLMRSSAWLMSRVRLEGTTDTG